MSDLYQRASQAMRAVEAKPELIDAAIVNLKSWLEEDAEGAHLDALEALLRQGNADELVSAFYRVLPFGTGGRRGPVGVGLNRINPRTVSACVEGHIMWLKQRFSSAERLKVVIAWDVRCFKDQRGLYGGHTSLHGTSSRSLGELAARIYASHGIESHLLLPHSERLVSTPELSFAIRHLGGHGGLNLSASHNPPDDNGVKVYDERGSMLAPPDDQSLLDCVAEAKASRPLSWDGALNGGWIKGLQQEVHDAWAATVALEAGDSPKDIGVLFTPLHGTGMVHDVLTAAGFSPQVHAPQAIPDGSFPTVPGHIANPERPVTFEHAIAHADDDVSIILGTDPDADRIGCAVRHQGEWVSLTGNQIGALVVHNVLKRTLKKQPLVVKTEVTSGLITAIGEAHGAALVDDLLVGFKYIGDVLKRLEVDGEAFGIQANDVQFVAGIEESHGVLITDAIRDKDAGGGALALTVEAARAKKDGKTLIDVLESLWQDHGYFINEQLRERFDGPSGPAKLAAILEGFRESPPSTIGGRSVERFVDHRDPAGRFGPILSETDNASRNVLSMKLSAGDNDDGARVILRPSGTEPLMKVYVELKGRPNTSNEGRVELKSTMMELQRGVRAMLSAEVA